MSHRICLASDPLRSGFPTDRSALWVHHRSDKPPAERTCEANEFVADPRPHLKGVDVVVLQNLVSKIIRPGSRLKYGQFLTDPWNGPPRLSVDTHLFIGDPWRIWFHFGAVDAPFGEPHEKYHTSYRVETDWRFFIEGKSPNPCTMDRVGRYGSGVVAWRGGFRFEPTELQVLAQGAAQHGLYQEERERAFNECKTSAALLKRLGDWAQNACPFRVIPKDIFATPRPRIVLTDFGVDRWIASQLSAQIQLTNDIVEAFQ